MTIETRQTNVPYSDALREHVSRRLNHAMSRFTERVGRVRVWIEDLNGPRHGQYDKVCRIVAEVAPKGTVVAEARADDYYDAVTQACVRLHAEVRRAMDRQHRSRTLRSARLHALM